MKPLKSKKPKNQKEGQEKQVLKNLHKFFYIATFICALALNPIATAQQSDLSGLDKITSEQMELVVQDVKVNDLDIEPINTQEVKKDVIPDTKNEGKKVIAYFLKAMLAVIFSAIILYFILVFVKKYYGSAFINQQQEDEFEAYDLTTPDSRQDALRSFLNRTK